MALGFGFNKTKVLAAAEKYVQQGKLQNAISEYLKVIKQDPKDLTVLNTVGDLYSRLGQSQQAIECFKRVGETYASDGFTVKAIAMFKKISKLASAGGEYTLKLAELYTQQGLYNDARSQYMHVADAHLRASNLPEAARIFQKMLELDPENAATQSKLADLYLRIGKKDDAKSIFFSAAQSLYSRGALDAADEALSRVISLEPNNGAALQLRGQIALDSGDAGSAVQFLENIADIDSRGEALKALLRARLMLGNTAEAEPIARKLLNVHNDPAGITMYAEALMAAEDCEAALRVYDENADRLLSTNPAATLQVLNASITRIKDNPTALAMLLSLYRRAGEFTHTGEVMELLAHAYVHSGELVKARDLYAELAKMEPENALHAQHHRQILGKLGEDISARPLTEEEGARAFMVDELEVPQLPQDYGTEVSDAIKAALTDSELLDTYNLPAKALPPLEAALATAPGDVQLNHRLASLYARAERYAEAAACCATLRAVFTEAGREEDASQYAQLAAGYRQRAGLPAEAPPVPPLVASAPPPAPVDLKVEFTPPAAAPPAARRLARPREIDLSDEWESMMAPVAPAAAPAEAPVQVEAEAEAPPPHAEAPVAVTPAAPPAKAPAPFVAQPVPPPQEGFPLADVLDEAHFYVSQGMWEEARSALARAEAIAPGDREVTDLRAQLEAAIAPRPQAAPQPAEPPKISEFVFDAALQEEGAAAEPEFAVEYTQPDEAPEFEVAARAEEPRAPQEVPPAMAAAPPAFRPPAPGPVAVAAKGVLDDFALDLAESLPADFEGTPAPPPVPSAPPVSRPAMSAAAATAGPAVPRMAPRPATAPAGAPMLDHTDISSALSDLFDEFKEGVEEATPEDEDPHTHYNLGVAFKEMALLDEAIGEFQKVCQAIERGRAFDETVQVYTLLASCFIEKGVPEASTKWYMKALQVPNVDGETRLAIHYELGAVFESAGDRKSALQHFMEVYGTNIDYRDVAERIKALRA